MLGVLEWIIVAFIVLGLVKVVIVAHNPKRWYKVVESMFKRPALVEIVSIVGAFVTLKYLLLEITVVQLFGSLVFMAFLMMAMYAVFPDVILQMTKKVLNNKKVLRRAWIVSLFWLGLMFWVLWTLFLG